VVNVKEDRLIVRIAENTRIELGRSFVSTVVKKTDESKK
jgi:preprotein translocase subunit YajC